MRALAPIAIVVCLVACSPEAGRFKPAAFSRTDAVTTVCAAGATVNGIDVSTWQGTIDWDSVAGSGLGFAIARISDGTGYYDDQFDRNWSEMKRVGLVRGAYQFFEPSEDAAAQANLVVRVVGQLGPSDLPVVLDVETATPTPDEIWTWVNAVQAGTGKTPMIYTSWGLWNSWISGGFESLPLWAANYGVSCPGLAANWSNWTMWQYADNTSVPGISGNVDGDVFNGSLQDLRNFAGSDSPPRGYLDSADCNAVAGWAQDPDAPNDAINVDLYFGGPAGSGVPGIRTVAGNNRTDLCTAIGSCNHGFSLQTPRGVMDGAAHDIHAYGIDTTGGNNPELGSSPKSVTCAPTEAGVLRHVTDPTSYAAWKFDGFMDVRPVSDSDLNNWSTAGDWPSTPMLIQGDGTPEVWIVDGVFRRHVVDPTSAGYWGFDLSTVQVQPHDQVFAMPQGPDLRYRPTLVKGSGDAIYELDDALPDLSPSDAGVSA